MKKLKVSARPNFPNSRKALRKQKRQEKKIHRQQFYLKKTNPPELPVSSPGRFVKRPVENSEEPNVKIKKKNSKIQPSIQEIINKERQKEIREADKLKSKMDEQRRKMLLKANEEEDKMIKKLEKQLGLNKSKNKTNFFTDDGLDYLLEICDKSTSEQIVAAEKHLAEVDGGSDFEEDLATVTGKEINTTEKNKKENNVKKKDKAETDDSSSENEESDISDGMDDELEHESNDENMSEVNDMSEDDNFIDNESLDDQPEEKLTKTQKSKGSKGKSETEAKKKSGSNKIKKDKVISEEEIGKVFSEDEVSQLSDDDDFEELSGNEVGDDTNDKREGDKPDVWEDIYGRKRDKDGNIIKEEKGVYIPPHLRNKDSGSEKELTQLKRHIKSVLNKLAGTNLHWACTCIEGLYGNNSRNSVNCALSELWREATVGAAATPARLAAEHAALVAVLHANVGSEIGAHFLQELCEKFDAMLHTSQPVSDKRLDNLVLCLAHLYNFKLYHASLLYDVLGRLLDELSEKNIECVVLALRSVGGTLRKEEPLALKTFIHETQAKLANLNESAAHGSRIKFLLEVLMAVKNNNLSKIPNYDPTYTEHLKKVTRGIVRKGNYVTPLNIRLEDLLKVDERGKWWVVGSAWEGKRVREEEKPASLPNVDQKLLELARKQRMNTDVRRSIFCVIMSAEDYMDAFEKLQHLGLKGQQEREIVHVLMACCLQERTYNPFYAVLGQKLCDSDRKYQLSIQFSVWDKIKDIQNLSKQCVTNLAQFLVHLIMAKGLALSVLKIIQFSDLNKHTVRFMRQILLAIIMNADLQASLEVFHRISKPPKLHMFRESLKLFIQHFLVRNAGNKSQVLNDSEMATLKERVVEVNKILTMYDSKLKL